MKRSTISLIIVVSVIVLIGSGVLTIFGINKLIEHTKVQAELAYEVEDIDTFIENVSEYRFWSMKSRTRLSAPGCTVYTICKVQGGVKYYVDETGRPNSTEKISVKVPKEYSSRVDYALGDYDDEGW